MSGHGGVNEPVRAVLFDLGGTLLEYTPAIGGATIAMLEELGLDPSIPEVRQALGTASVDVGKQYAARTSFLHRDLFREQAARAAALLGVEAPADVLERFDVANREGIIEHLRPRPDAAAVLEALKERGIYRAVVSNADDDFLGPSLSRHGLDRFVDDWTSSEEAASCKPDPVIYRLALTKAGCGPADALFVGDSLQHDVAGASAIGIRSVLIVGAPGPAPLSHGLDAAVTPDFEVRTLTEVVLLVDELNGAA